MKKVDKVMLVTPQNTLCEPNSFACADECVDEWFERLVLNKIELDINICVVSTNVQLLRMRVGVLRGEITPFELWVDFDKFTECDANGRLGKHPTQLDKSMNMLAELGRARRSTLGQTSVETENQK